MVKQELLEKLRELDEVLLLELLNITSEEIVDSFLDRIAEYENQLSRQVEEL